jgi:hypothetical protein
MCWNAEEALEPDQRDSLSMFEQPNVYRQFETKEEMQAAIRQEMLRKAFFVETLMNPAFHWYFTQGQDALVAGLILPGISSLLNGIEGSIRVTVAQLAEDYHGDLVLDRQVVLSNRLLRRARDLGLPVDLLAFPGEDDFAQALGTRTNVKLVQLRHDINHGNLLPFIREEAEFRILTPECLIAEAAILLGIAYEWAAALAKFREETGWRPSSQGEPIPEIPQNPLRQYLPSVST